MDLSIGKSRWLRVSTLVAGAAVLLSACGGSSTTGQSITNGGTLVWALDADAQSLNPFVAGDVPSVRAYGFLFPNIYQADANLNITPDLADGMPSISSDGKVWTVKLRKNAKWSDGSPITADDVVMTVNLQNNDKLDTDASFDWGELDNVAKVDANTVKFTLKDVFAPFLANNLLTFVAPNSVYGKIDPAKQRTDPVSLNPTVTGGPYKFDKRVAGSEIDYVFNPNYYLGRPHYDKVIAKVITDATAGTNALINGDVQWHPALGEGGSGSVNKAKAATGVQVHDYADLGYIDMRLNTRKGHLMDNVLTRQAMATALDKPSIVQAATEGRGQVLWGDLVPAYWAYDASSVVTFTQDVTKAKSLMTQAGWTIGADGVATRPNPSGTGTQRFVGKIRVRAGKAQRIKAAQIISDQLKAIGMQLTPDPTDFKVFYTPIRKGDFDVAIAGFGLTVDPDNFTTFHSSQLQPENKAGSNWTGYKNPQLDSLIDQERTTNKSTVAATVAARKAIFAQIEKIISGDVVTYMLWADKSAMGWSSNVGGVVAGGGDNVIYVDDARNTQVEAQWYSKNGK
jgi:peptide/nickel transport system substrate-binding protein